MTEDFLAGIAERYAVAITPAMASLIDDGDPADPIALQFAPDVRELSTMPHERGDPLEDAAHSPVPGIVHRYGDRCLLKVTHVCPVYCRFCFRREAVGPGRTAPMTGDKLDAAFTYIAEHPELREVILTGGDPFMLSPRRAAEVTRRLSAVPHLDVIRWHTRMPVVDPGRVTSSFVDALRSDKAVFVAAHANHPREITDEARGALARLADAGIALLSQSVLLRGVNDSVETLAALMRALVAARVKPYYLHQLDPAPGTSHFRVSEEEGRALMAALRARVSGLCMPAYVRDDADASAKTPL
jgi:lysine 2,3-aminomutase